MDASFDKNVSIIRVNENRSLSLSGLSHLRNISSTLIALRSSFHVEIKTTSLAYGSPRLHSGSQNSSATSPITRTHSSALQLIIMRLGGKQKMSLPRASCANVIRHPELINVW
ncbi:hypothetical protein CDAR_188101 [Caerostris darwini]|uniref:Uncharacterized protein n=1 Tax=Caerostris darwini TaxID=1538125 RepID=A0AAV4N9P4_9ARAC|nr:hypothetical protein CDAR_188101 [Caerostris darwini]